MKPILTVNEIRSKVSEMEKTLSGDSLILWKLIRIHPAKWTAEDADCWVVAIVGPLVIWYDGFRERFISSGYTVFGSIERSAGKIAQSDVPDTLLSLLSALRATANPQ